MDSAETDFQRRFYDMLMRSQYWPAEKIRDYQRSQLAQLLRHASKNVPFYEGRLGAVVRPNGDVDWDRWSEIPILTRSDLIEHREAMQARELPPGHGGLWVVRSSGSTGMPMETTHNQLTSLGSNAAVGRAYTWHGVDLNRTLVNIYGDNPARAPWPTGLDRGQWGPLFMREGRVGRRLDLNLLVTPDQALEFIQRIKPDYLNGLTSRLLVLANESRRLRLDIKIDTILTRGEEVTPERSDLFADVFGARTIALYSAQETHKMAHPCPDCGVFHTNAELMLIEVIGEDGHAVAPGESGRVIVTPFFNTAQPLVRYQIGDIAELGPACTCGRTLPVLTRIMGRIAHMFRLPDGGHILPNVADGDLVRFGARMWQLAQVGPDRVEFRYVANERTGDEAAFGKILRARLHPAFALSIRRVDGFPLTANRKHIPYVREI